MLFTLYTYYKHTINILYIRYKYAINTLHFTLIGIFIILVILFKPY